MAAQLDGIALGSIAAGSLFLWSALNGKTILGTISTLIKGKSPATAKASPAVLTAATTTSAVGSPAPGNTGAANGTAAQNQASAKTIAAGMGFSSWTTGTEWADWVSLWNQESSWNGNAQNPTSTAYGIAQFLDSTWSPYGPKTSDVSLQIKYGIEYIRDRYGSPSLAWAHEQANNWY